MSRRPTPPSRRRLRRCSQAVAALAVTGLVGAASVAPVAAVQPAVPVGLSLVSQSTWVHPGEELRLGLNVQGAPADAVVHVDVHSELDSRAGFDATLAEEDAELGSTVGGWQDPLSTLAANANGTRDTARAIPSDEVPLDDDGVYPVEVSVQSPAGDVLASFVTYLLYVTEDSATFPELSVSVVVDVGAPPALQPDGSVQLSDAAVEEMEGRVSALMSVPDVPASVAPVPETIDSLAETGTAGVDLIENDFQDVIGGREVVARPYVDLDLEAMVAAGLLTEAPLEAEGGAQVIRNRFVDPRTDGPKEPMGDLWLLDDGAGAGDASALRELGVTRAVVPESAVAPVEQPEGPVPTGPVSLGEGGPVGMVADEQLAARLTGGTNPALDVQRFLAELVTMWGAQPAIERGVVVRVPAEANVAPNVLAQALRGLGDSDVLEPVNLSQIFATVPPAGEDDQPDTVEWTGGGASVQLDGLASPLLAAQKTLIGLAATLNDSTQIGSLRRSLLVSLGSQTPDDQRLAYVQRVDNAANLVRDAITAPDEFQITLTASNGTVPLVIDNSLDQAVSLRISLRSNQIDFPEGETIELDAAEPGRTTLDIPVETLTSGAMPLRITITSPDGSIVLAESNYVVRSTAISGVGLVLSVGAGAFLLLWWGRHWRTARRSRRLLGSAGQGVDTHNM